MTAEGDSRALCVDRAASARLVRVAVVVGWSLLAGFALWVAAIGQIAGDIRAFQIAYLLGFCGYLALLWAIGRAKHGGRCPPHVLGSWRWWLVGCIAVRASLLATQPSDDAYRYVWEGRVQLAGHNPFLLAPDDPRLSDLRDENWTQINHPDHRAIYPPLAQLEFAAAAAAWPSIYSVKLLHVLWDVLIVVVLAAVLRRRGRREHWAIAYGLCPLVLSAIAVEGHLDSLMLLFVILAVWAVSAGRISLAGAMLGLAIAAKVIAVVLLPWFLFRHRRAALIALAVAALPCLPYWDSGFAVLANLVHFARMGECFSLLGAFSVISLESAIARGAVAAVLGVTLAALAWRRDDLTRYGAGATAALLMLLPVVHFWYATWAMLFIPFRLELRWIVMALAMVTCFEAQLRRSLTGAWAMPDWAPVVAWAAFLSAWALEALARFAYASRFRARRRPPRGQRSA